MHAERGGRGGGGEGGDLGEEVGLQLCGAVRFTGGGVAGDYD
jgi:hypothetical protein